MPSGSQRAVSGSATNSPIRWSLPLSLGAHAAICLAAVLALPPPEKFEGEKEKVISIDIVSLANPAEPDAKLEPEAAEAKEEPIEVQATGHQGSTGGAKAVLFAAVRKESMAADAVAIPADAKKREGPRNEEAKETPEKEAKRKPERKKAKAERKEKAKKGSGSEEPSERRDGKTGVASRRAAGTASLSKYVGEIAARLQSQKRYPKSAERQGIGGTAVISFTIDERGVVTGSRLVRSSGEELLDREVIAMLARAAPFPPIPEDMGRKTLTVTVPVRFAPQ